MGLTEYRNRSLAFVREALGLPPTWSAPTCTEWVRTNADLLHPLSEGEKPPHLSVLFWTDPRWGYCAIYVGKGKILGIDGVLPLHYPERVWGDTFAGWVKP